MNVSAECHAEVKSSLGYLELGQVVDVLVDDDPEVVGLVVRLHVFL